MARNEFDVIFIFFSCMNIGIANEVGEGSHVQGNSLAEPGLIGR